MFDLILSISKYQDKLIVKTDPRVKLILMILFITVMLISKNIYQIIVLSVLICSLVVGSRLPVIPIIKNILKIYPIIIIVSLFQLISQIGGENLYSIEVLRIGNIDWTKLFVFQLKSVAILMAGLIFVVSTPHSLLLMSLQKMHVPDRAIAILFFIFRFIFLLSHELDRIYLAFKSRYIKLPLLKRLSVYSNLISIYFMRIFDRNEHLFKVLVSRGFQGKVYCAHTLDWTINDSWILMTGGSFLTLIFLYI